MRRKSTHVSFSYAHSAFLLGVSNFGPQQIRSGWLDLQNIPYQLFFTSLLIRDNELMSTKSCSAQPVLGDDNK